MLCLLELLQQFNLMMHHTTGQDQPGLKITHQQLDLFKLKMDHQPTMKWLSIVKLTQPPLDSYNLKMDHQLITRWPFIVKSTQHLLVSSNLDLLLVLNLVLLVSHAALMMTNFSPLE